MATRAVSGYILQRIMGNKGQAIKTVLGNWKMLLYNRIMSILKTVCKPVYLRLKILHIKKTVLGFQ